MLPFSPSYDRKFTGGLLAVTHTHFKVLSDSNPVGFSLCIPVQKSLITHLLMQPSRNKTIDPGIRLSGKSPERSFNLIYLAERS